MKNTETEHVDSIDSILSLQGVICLTICYYDCYSGILTLDALA